MQSCSVHHCVLLLLTLTFTTAPVAAAVLPIQAKLHQPVTLPCAHNCSGEAMWTFKSNRSVVARCDQTSCSSVVKGYEMPHDQYLKGDLSLTITAAEYSMRNTYACECRKLDYAEWRLSIETVFSVVQKNPGEDLILDLTVPEPVEVIYTSSDSADGERICNVTQHSLQCKAEYTHRTSLRYPELTLRDVTHSDSGRYTIRDTENKEDIRVYAVSVTGLTKGVTAGIVVPVLVLVLGIIGVMIYKRRAAEEELRKVEKQKEAVYEQFNELSEPLQPENPGIRDQNSPNTNQNQIEEKMGEVEKMINDLEERYRANREYSESIRLFCCKRRRDLKLYRRLYEKPDKEYILTQEVVEVMEVMKVMEQVVKGFDHLSSRKSPDPRNYTLDVMNVNLEYIKSWCKKKRNKLDIFKEEPGAEANVKLMIDDTEALLSAWGKWCEDKEEEMQKYKPQPVSAERSDNESVQSEPLSILHSIKPKKLGGGKHRRSKTHV